MIHVKVAVGVLNQIPLDWDGNRERISRAIAMAREQGATVLCLPELCITGYGCEDAYYAPHTSRTAWEMLLTILPETHGLVVSVGLPIHYRQAIFNVAALISDGKILGFTAKQNLAGDGIHYEPRWFKAWPKGITTTYEIGGHRIPLGDLYYRVGDLHIGFEICEDAWVADRPGITLAKRGVDLILNPSASHFSFDKVDVRRRYVAESSRAFGASYLYANMLGNESGRAIYDGGAMISTMGQLVAETPRLSFKDVDIATAVLDIDTARMNQSRVASFRPTLDECEDFCIATEFSWPKIKMEPKNLRHSDWDKPGFRKEEEFTRAVSLGLFDYLRKSWSRGFVVSLSGGADSTACAVLCHTMIHYAIADLGLEGFKKRLAYRQDLQELSDPKDITRALLTTAYQGTENSGDATRAAAAEVANGIGTTHYELPVGEIHRAYIDLIGKALGRELTWKQDDIALQNIQARLRSPSIWMLANIQNFLLLSTSNRSEAAVGYATMDGDTSGGLSPIAGIDKAFLRHWLRWLETVGPLEIGPLSCVGVVNRLQPTAELRPPDQKQTDEDDLMPYEVLDAVERAAIRDKKNPIAVYHDIHDRFPDYTRQELALWIERFFKLWSRNQWKRERYAPSFHLDDENLDPKTWCRFPILSGGFQKELREFRDYVKTEID